jgi:hypothetical protein
MDPHSTLFGALAESSFLRGVFTMFLLVGPVVLLSTLPLHNGSQSFVWPASAALIGLVVNSLNADIMNFRFVWGALAVM